MGGGGFNNRGTIVYDTVDPVAELRNDVFWRLHELEMRINQLKISELQKNLTLQDE